MTLAATLADNASLMTTPVGSAPLYSARAWVNFNGTGTVAIRASGNVSSITDNGTGDYTVNFATAMSDANYSVTGANNWDNGSVNLVFSITNVATSNYRIRTPYGINNTFYDPVGVFSAVFR